MQGELHLGRIGDMNMIKNMWSSQRTNKSLLH